MNFEQAQILLCYRQEITELNSYFDKKSGEN